MGCGEMSVTQKQKVDYASAVIGILGDVLVDKQNGMPDVVWHYTPYETLLKILESKSLWATHVSCLNDASEVRHLFDLLFEQLHGREVDPQSSPLFEYLKSLGGKDYGGSSEWFVTSFCTESDALNLWRAYAGADGGVAIGFETKEVVGRAWKDESRGGHQGFPETYVLPVAYRAAKKNDLVQKLLSETERLFKAGLEGQDHKTWAEEFWTAWEDQIAAIAPLVKHEAFESEKEWRLITKPHASQQNSLKFLARRTTITRHLPLQLRPIADADPAMLPIVEIKIGPGEHQKLTKVNVKELLRSKGYIDVRVTRSKIPFRLL